jgi:hypothetical protein
MMLPSPPAHDLVSEEQEGKRRAEAQTAVTPVTHGTSFCGLSSPVSVVLGYTIEDRSKIPGWKKDFFVSIVTGYGLGDRGSIPGRGGGLFLCPLCPAGSGTHPDTCTMGTEGSSSRGKMRLGHDADHSPPSSAEVKKKRGL